MKFIQIKDYLKVFSFFVICICFVLVGIGLQKKVYAANNNIEITKIYNTKTGNTIKWTSKKTYSGYAIYRSVDGSKYKKVDTTTSKKYNDTEIETGSKYQYKIKPYQLKKGKKVYSTKSEKSKECVALPYSVESATVVVMTDYNLISWKKNSFATGYYIYRSVDNINWEKIVTIYDELGFFEDRTIEKGKKYNYKITAFELVDGEYYESLPCIVLKASQIKGIDVSYHNGKINWSKVKKSGSTFAMIRLGYGTKKGGVIDSKLDYNYNQAKKYGIRVGFYLYSYADNTKEAKKEAKFTLELLKKYKDFDYPVVFDFENAYRNKKKYKKSNTKIITTYCDYLEKKGYDTCVYSYLDFFRKAVNYKKISKYGIWLARWTNDPDKFSSGNIPNVQLWQYSDNGKVEGIKGVVDMNIQILQK